MLYIISGNILNPISIPIIPPNNVAKMAYIIYFDAIFNFVYPNAFNVPICTLCSSTILVIDVKLISAAITKNTTGNTYPIFAIRSES